ncbi:MAG: type I-E CRISPR-associated protein Cas7/Cse4/CasC [Deltaproteobacteria bacterium]|uniref:Type I-E CRISPR-associated protein Cas7/Cse4/CasC n=1 Tax=Candidatus Desulfacyla euxinica TaxID=2841693 RepID=A0A8J6MZZ2_9DELT|nr:type I-E CRISPR-associated protein Cas7/Cse4/CasC [Candidatus Desulfacyla euxinica]
MKHLELHIIQSVPVACLNRDDLNSPKTAIFGGVQRARVSSQSWKRAIREMAKEMDSSLFKGNRSRRMVYELTTKLESKDVAKDIAVIIAEQVAGIVETLDSKKDSDGFKKIKTLMFFSDAEYDAIANAITDDIKESAETVVSSSNAVEAHKENLKKIDNNKDEQEKAKKKLENLEKEMEKNKKALLKAFNDKSIKAAIKSAQLKDAADIALFGRMVASDHSLTVEAASMFSHALSTHKADNEIDFFAAVDDLQSKEESGAGMTSTLEFNSATYYRFAALNLDMLADKEHLDALTHEERQSVVRTFVEATVKAIPGARKNTMNGNTLPVYVLGIVREKGHPVQLVNAFESPVRSSNGYTSKSVELLKTEYAKLSETWGIEAVFEEAIPDVGIKFFLDEVVKHVI